MKKNSLIWAIILLVSIQQASAQNPNPCDLDPFCDDADGMEEVPLDGGIGFLVAAGMLYGAKKIRDNGKQTIK